MGMKPMLLSTQVGVACISAASSARKMISAANLASF